MRIILGAGQTTQEGWQATQESELNLLNDKDWAIHFEEGSIDALLAEHVWEHMTYEEGIKAAELCYKYLKRGGYLRCAVPDKNFDDDWYQNMVQVGGPGPKDHPAVTHKIVYDYKEFVDVFERAGFKVELLEYCDENHQFHHKYWNELNGKINRSYRFDTRNNEKCLKMVSIILDAKKEL